MRGARSSVRRTAPRRTGKASRRSSRPPTRAERGRSGTGRSRSTRARRPTRYRSPCPSSGAGRRLVRSLLPSTWTSGRNGEPPTGDTRRIRMTFFHHMGIRARLSLLVTGLAIAAIAAMVAVIGVRVSSFAKDSAIQFAMESARAKGGAVQNILDNALDQAVSLSRVFEAASVVANAGISRRQANSILQYYIEHSPRLFGAYVAFEPNAYDGKDAN